MGNNKIVKRKKSRTVERFTKLQLKLSSCFKDLILLNDLSIKDNGLSLSVIRHLQSLIKTITGMKFFLYDHNNNNLFCDHYHISFDGTQLLTFTNIMDQLREAVRSQISTHFILTNVNDNTITSIDTLDPENASAFDKLTGITFNRVAATAVLNDSTINKHIGNVRITSRNDRMFQVIPISSFGSNLLMAQPRENPLDTIPSITFQSWTSFIQIFRSILINYHTAFGNFERIKSCQQCGKLFFEKKKTTKKFCGRNCMTRHSNGPPERYKCKARQNRWLKYKYEMDPKININDLPDGDTGNTIIKEDCADCVIYPASGECIKLQKKNPNLFSLLRSSKKN